MPNMFRCTVISPTFPSKRNIIVLNEKTDQKRFFHAFPGEKTHNAASHSDEFLQNAQHAFVSLSQFYIWTIRYWPEKSPNQVVVVATLHRQNIALTIRFFIIIFFSLLFQMMKISFEQRIHLIIKSKNDIFTEWMRFMN